MKKIKTQNQNSSKLKGSYHTFTLCSYHTNQVEEQQKLANSDSTHLHQFHNLIHFTQNS